MRPFGPFTLTILLSAACLAGDNPPDQAELEIVGVIEGFYGTPWSHQDRLDLVDFMGRVGLKDYIYAPKDDPFHLARWREPYPDDLLNQLQELADSSAAHGIRLWFAISPGGTIEYSSEVEYETLMEKVDAIYGTGVRHFGLFVDDVNADLIHENDKTTFSSLAAAHISLTNRMAADLQARGAELAFTPTTYTNAWGDRAYARAVGAGITPTVPIVWTGRDVASPVITAEHAREWGELIGRPPLLWDNYPVNDYAPWRLFLGPITGRAANLGTELTGIVSNPMNQVHASMLALHSLASYVRDPAAYNPERARQSAVDELFGQDSRHTGALMALFGDNGWDDNLLEPLFFVRDTIDLTPIARALAAARMELDSLSRSDHRFSQQFAAEVTPILNGLDEKITEISTDPQYREEDDRLVFVGRESYLAGNATPEIDGNLSDWSTDGSHPLHGPVQATVRFSMDATHLYLAVSVVSDRTSVRSGPNLPEGDHIEVIQQISGGDLLTNEDRVVLISAPSAAGGSEALIRTLRIDGFMTKWLQDNARLTFNAFHMTNMADPDNRPGILWATRATRSGYDAEIALPLGSLEPSIAIQVSDRSSGRKQVGSISPRNFPMNPRTFITISRARNR